MPNQYGERRQLADWFRQQLEEYQVTVEEAAISLGLSKGTIRRMISGNLRWAMLPPEVKRGLQEMFGEFLTEEKGVTPEHSSLKPPDASTLDKSLPRYLESILPDLEAIISEEVERLGQESTNNADRGCKQPLYSELVSSAEALEDHCNRCGTRILVKHEGRCPYCKRRTDGAQ